MADSNSTGRRQSSRRVVSSAKEQRKSALEELKNARKSGKIYRRNTDNLVEDVYKTVTEEEYNEIQKQRADKNFVEDDDGTGYYDDGTFDDFDEEEEQYAQSSSSKDNHKARKEEKKKKKGGIFEFLSVNAKPKETTSENAPCNLEEDPDMLSMLEQLDQSYATDNAVENPAFSFGSNNFGEPLNTQPSESFQLGSTLSWPAENPFDEPAVKEQINIPTEQVSVPAEKVVKRTMPISPSETSAPKVLKLDKEKEEVEQTPLMQDQNFDQFDQFESANNFEEMEEEDQKEIDEQPENSDVLRMYWTETFEDVYKDPGSVYLFGKVNGQSCCVLVRNIKHKVYFLPRKLDGDSDQNLTEVRNEVAAMFKNNSFFQTSDTKDKTFQSAFETIKWIPTDEDTPRELRALMVSYKGHLPNIPVKATGSTFSHVLNTTATAMERLLLESKLRGPCWIDISNAVESKKKLSHCALEYIVDLKTKDNYNISTANTNKPSPFVNLLALNIIGVPSSDNKETEVIMISGLYRNRGFLDRANNRSQQAYETFCFMTNPKKGVIPLTFDLQLKNAKIKPESVQKVPNERVLLNLFFAKMKQIDPDIIIMHDSHAQLSLLISRVEKYTIKTWHFISRLAQYQQPGRLCKTKAGQWELVAGRSVLCSKTASEELYPTKSYELGDLIALLLPEASRVPLTFSQITETFTSHKPTLSISQLIQWSWLEAYFALQIVFQLNALPLFVQITQIVGGVLSRTLFGGRAERNEYLLLHAFYESGYIPPDKYQYGGKKGQKALKEEPDPDGDETKTGANRKAQYTGGLVLEPKKGFYDSYIVLLDFNSLYPSIIQEFNICFTTIDRCYEEPNEKGLPEPPRDSVPEGILPIQIGNLVRNRREVKVQMQKVKPGTDEYMRLDVRQKGLKLTANSMYGCLGFGMSRFCAKTLAAMITFKGRELLSRTKELVEERGYSVVYGDTDSIMVNTNTSVHGEACRLAFELRKVVNGGFKHVEMDVDGLFKRLLLLKKKKYAALTVSLKSDTNPKKEMKGLDIVRRDWSKLAKDVGERVVDLILSSKEREDLVNEVVSTLSELAENLKAGKIPAEDFEILKQLTKSPKEYGGTKTLPHVTVAQRLNAEHGFHLRQGDVVKYVICQDGTSNSAVQRAYHLSELADNENLAVDGHYYLSQQVHPVVMRLCEPFDELDSGRIAEALGLDPVGYRSQVNKVSDYSSYNIAIEASADYDQCDGFKFKCSECAKWSAIRSPFVDKNPSSGLALEKCPECKCRLAQQYETLKSSFIVQLNSFISKHATAKFVCDDNTCAYQTSDSSELVWTSSQGPTCPQCKSTYLRKEFSLRDLFYQQKFFYEHIFNLGDQEKNGPAVQFYNDCKKLAFEHLKANNYNRVNLGRLLSGFNRRK